MKLKGRSQIISIGVLILVLFFLNKTSTELPEKYSWGNIDNYNQLFLKTKNNKKPLIMYFHVDWCKFCKKLNENFLKNESVYNLLSNIQMIQINPEHGSRQKQIATQYGAKGYPTFLVTHPHTNKTKRVHPFKKGGKVWTIEKFIDKLKYAIEHTGK